MDNRIIIILILLIFFMIWLNFVSNIWKKIKDFLFPKSPTISQNNSNYNNSIITTGNTGSITIGSIKEEFKEITIGKIIDNKGFIINKEFQNIIISYDKEFQPIIIREKFDEKDIKKLINISGDIFQINSEGLKEIRNFKYKIFEPEITEYKSLIFIKDDFNKKFINFKFYKNSPTEFTKAILEKSFLNDEDIEKIKNSFKSSDDTFSLNGIVIEIKSIEYSGEKISYKIKIN